MIKIASAVCSFATREKRSERTKKSAERLIARRPMAGLKGSDLHN